VLSSAHAAHYEASGAQFTRARLGTLYDLVLEAIDHRDLTAISAYAHDVAAERFDAGFDISEVQLAFGSLEAAMWRCLVAGESPDQLVEAVGLLGTVVGAAKDSLAQTYVSLAAKRHVPTLDLSALFKGGSSGGRSVAGPGRSRSPRPPARLLPGGARPAVPPAPAPRAAPRRAGSGR
jgi:hypothetical protein